MALRLLRRTAVARQGGKQAPEPVHLGPSSIAQKAGGSRLYRPAGVRRGRCAAHLSSRRNLVVKLAKEIPGLKVNEPQGAFYLFPEVSAYFGKRYGDRVISDAGDLALYLLDQAHVATVDGAAFCAPGYIRLSYATSDDNIREAMDA